MAALCNSQQKNLALSLFWKGFFQKLFETSPTVPGNVFQMYWHTFDSGIILFRRLMKPGPFHEKGFQLKTKIYFCISIACVVSG